MWYDQIEIDNPIKYFGYSDKKIVEQKISIPIMFIMDKTIRYGMNNENLFEKVTIRIVDVKDSILNILFDIATHKTEYFRKRTKKIFNIESSEFKDCIYDISGKSQGYNAHYGLLSKVTNRTNETIHFIVNYNDPSCSITEFGYSTSIQIMEKQMLDYNVQCLGKQVFHSLEPGQSTYVGFHLVHDKGVVWQNDKLRKIIESI